MPEEVTTPKQLSVRLQQQPREVGRLSQRRYVLRHLPQDPYTQTRRDHTSVQNVCGNVTNEQNSLLREALDTKSALTGQIRVVPPAC